MDVALDEERGGHHDGRHAEQGVGMEHADDPWSQDRSRGRAAAEAAEQDPVVTGTEAERPPHDDGEEGRKRRARQDHQHDAHQHGANEL